MRIPPTLARLQYVSLTSPHLQGIVLWVRGGASGDWIVRDGRLRPIPLGRRVP